MAFVALSFSMIACEEEDSVHPNSGVTPPPTSEPEQLAAPVLSLVEATAEGFVLEWSAVEHAAAYAYVIGNGEEVATQQCRLAISGLEPETTYLVKVKSLSADLTRYTESLWGSLSVTTLEEQEPDGPDGPDGPDQPTTGVVEGGYYIPTAEYDDGTLYYNQIYVEHQQGNEYYVYNFFDYADEIMPATYDPENQTFTLSGYSIYNGELAPFFGYAMYYFDEEQTMTIGLFCYADPEDENAYGDDPFVISVENGYLSTAMCDVYEIIFDNETGENLGYYSLILAGDKYTYGEAPATLSLKKHSKGGVCRTRIAK